MPADAGIQVRFDQGQNSLDSGFSPNDREERQQ
jgi:hypothetical protein